MRTASVLLLLVVLVTGIAVNGSRAQPLAETGVAFQQCTADAGMSPGRCGRHGRALIAMEEVGEGAAVGGDLAGYEAGSVGGDIAAGGEDFLRELAAKALEAFLVGLARYVVAHFVGGSLPLTLEGGAEALLFDPVR